MGGNGEGVGVKGGPRVGVRGRKGAMGCKVERETEKLYEALST